MYISTGVGLHVCADVDVDTEADEELALVWPGAAQTVPAPRTGPTLARASVLSHRTMILKKHINNYIKKHISKPISIIKEFLIIKSTYQKLCQTIFHG